jgi:phage terminase large subunit GpA-like protein
MFKSIPEDAVRRVHGHVQASKGVGKHPFQVVSRGKLSTVAGNLKGRYLGTWQAKDRIYERLRMIPEPNDTRSGIMHYNLQYREEYFQGLTIESATQKINGDQVYNTYKDEVTGNEPLDIEVGCLAAVRLHNRNWEAMKKALLDSVTEGEEKPKKSAPVAGRSGLGRGWNL